MVSVIDTSMFCLLTLAIRDRQRNMLRAVNEARATDCLFCRISSAGPPDLPPHLLYEDAVLMVLLDRQSLGPGHSMIIPRRHVTEIHELNEVEYLALFQLAHMLAPCLKEVMRTRAVGFVAFGSGLPHAHLHLVPHDEDAVLLEPLKYLRNLSDEELQRDAARIRSCFERPGGFDSEPVKV
jgi:histidine triad (HIT) family protein